ncbi:MAG: ABC transporter ATP-binding protein [Chloroflexi bacterium]|nr:ABC transporter ATP-binding protein [Chloroflexota bacterium]
MASVTLRNVTKRYGGAVLAVDNISLSVADGEFLALLGPSGCGKTSTMRMIAGLEDISEGEILVDDTITNNLSSAERNVAMAFENYGLYPHKTVFGNIAYPLVVRRRSRRDIEDNVLRVAAMLHIDDVLDRKPAELSGGFQQRVSLARALVREPSVFLMDEPISHLDADLRSVMRGELKRLQKDNGATTIYVTHDQLEAMSMADRIAVMDHGVLQQVGTPLEIFNAPANEFVASFIGEPPMNLFTAHVGASDDGRSPVLIGEHELLVLDDRLRAGALADGGAIRVGVRPKDFVLNASASDASMPAEVRVAEALIDRVLATLDSPAGRLRLELPAGTNLREGERVRVAPRADRIHLFDPETGKAIRLV